jgi:hypothetical protein
MRRPTLRGLGQNLFFASAFGPARCCIPGMRPSPRVLRFVPLGRAILLGIACLTPPLCFGALTWDARKIEVTAEFEATQATAVFHFKNAGSESVTIVAIKPSCGCTAVELAKPTYAPGEAGEIKTVSTFGGAVGIQEKSLEVTTSDAPVKPVTLVVRISVPELFTTSNRLFIWRVNEELAEQSATISCAKELTGIEVGPDTPATVTCRVEPVEAGKSYRISLRPKSSAQLLSVQVPLVARLADRTTRPIVLFVLVR